MITTVLLVINLVLSIACLENKTLFYKLCWNPHSVKYDKQYYRAITHAFIHVDIPHLVINMFVLYNFGDILEKAFGYIYENKGAFYFVLLYLGGIIFSLPVSYKRHQDNPGYNAAGASGAVSAVIFSFILIAPTQSLYLMFIPVPVPAFLFGGLYLILEAVLDKRGRDHIAHDAHLWGALFGFFFTGLVKPDLFMSFVEQVGNFINGQS